MKKVLRIAIVGAALASMFIPEVIYAQVGRVHRATRRRTAVVVGSTTKAAGASQAAAAQQQTAAAQQQAAASQQQAAAAENAAAAARQEAAAAKQELAVAQGLLPLGSVVRSLPKGCVPTAIGGVEYYHCGVNYYRAVFEGNNLVYVTSKPGQ